MFPLSSRRSLCARFRASCSRCTSPVPIPWIWTRKRRSLFRVNQQFPPNCFLGLHRPREICRNDWGHRSSPKQIARASPFSSYQQIQSCRGTPKFTGSFENCIKLLRFGFSANSNTTKMTRTKYDVSGFLHEIDYEKKNSEPWPPAPLCVFGRPAIFGQYFFKIMFDFTRRALGDV